MKVSSERNSLLLGLCVLSLGIALAAAWYGNPEETALMVIANESQAEVEEKKFIKWVEFNVPYEAMKKAIALDAETKDAEIHLNYIEMLAYLATKNGNNFKSYKESQLNDIAETLQSGKTMEIGRAHV